MSCCAWNTIVFEWADKQKKQDSEKKPYPKHFEEANVFFFFFFLTMKFQFYQY